MTKRVSWIPESYGYMKKQWFAVDTKINYEHQLMLTNVCQDMYTFCQDSPDKDHMSRQQPIHKWNSPGNCLLLINIIPSVKKSQRKIIFQKFVTETYTQKKTKLNFLTWWQKQISWFSRVFACSNSICVFNDNTVSLKSLGYHISIRKKEDIASAKILLWTRKNVHVPQNSC